MKSDSQGNILCSRLDNSPMRLITCIAVATALSFTACQPKGSLVEVPPEIEAQPKVIDFGFGQIGSVVERSFFITNRGTSPLILNSITFTGDASSQFNAKPLDSMEVAPDKTVAIKLEYAPAAVGIHQASLLVKSNATNFPELTVSVLGATQENGSCSDNQCFSPPGPCFESTGTCVDGTCAYSLKADGASCNDGNACTTNDVCALSTCAGTPSTTVGCVDCEVGFEACASGCCPISSPLGKIACGTAHSCVVVGQPNQVKCWGLNTDFQLGLGTSRPSPTDAVSELQGEVLTLSAGNVSNCVLLTGGKVKCWGGNTTAQLGNGTLDKSSVAVDVTGLSSGVAEIAVGRNNACALLSTGAVKCWGRVDLNTNITTPTQIPGLESNVTSISASDSGACALMKTGGMKCWGQNYFGEVGDGTKEPRIVPTDVAGLSSGVKAIAGSNYANCALMETGTVKCWGQKLFVSQTSVPVDVPGVPNAITKMALAQGVLCVLTSSGGVQCAGSNSSGQLGNGGPTTQTNQPFSDVLGLSSGVADISASHLHACATLQAGGARCWGGNPNGELGNGTVGGISSTPVTVEGL